MRSMAFMIRMSQGMRRAQDADAVARLSRTRVVDRCATRCVGTRRRSRPSRVRTRLRNRTNAFVRRSGMGSEANWLSPSFRRTGLHTHELAHKARRNSVPQRATKRLVSVAAGFDGNRARP